MIVGSDFFRTFGVKLSEGREFAVDDDRSQQSVVIVNQSFADRFFAEESSLGQQLRLGDADSTKPWMTIVGVVPDMNISGVDDREPEGVYVPLAQHDASLMSVVVHVRDQDTLAVTPMVRHELSAIDPNLPLDQVNTVARFINESTWFYGVFAALFTLFGATALFLAAVGLYAVMAFSVGQRRKEIGVRRALGARNGDLFKLIARQALFQLIFGVGIGLFLASSLAHGLQAVLFHVEPFDQLTFSSVAILLFLTSMLASLIPTWRATHIDPNVALRYE